MLGRYLGREIHICITTDFSLSDAYMVDSVRKLVSFALSCSYGSISPNKFEKNMMMSGFCVERGLLYG